MGKYRELLSTTPVPIRKKVDSWKRNGERAPLTVREAKLLLKANCIIDTAGCWIWQLSTYGNGYGRLPCRAWKAIGSRTDRVHVVAYQLWKGPVTAGLYVCHSCDVKLCFNPKHLWLGTNQENQIDASEKGVFARYWTKEKRMSYSQTYSGAGNPMYGRTGEAAPAYGRIGSLHPMFGKHHTAESKDKISAGLLLAREEGRR